MSTKSYVLLTNSRQWPAKTAGDTVELPPAAAKYLVQAGVLAVASPPEGSVATDHGTVPGKRRKAEG
jgi:hypothetical protein